MAIPIGSDAHDFSLPTVDGGTVSLSQYPEAVAYCVVFWCNHCPYVVGYEDRFIDLVNRYKDQGVVFIAINANDANQYPQDSFEAMKQRAQEKNYPFIYVYDEEQSVARMYMAERTPEFFLFDSEKELRYHGRFDDNHEDARAAQRHFLEDAINSVLEGEPPHMPNTAPIGCTIKWKP